MISIVIVTCERSHLLKQCFENVVARASDRVTEVVVWNNASADDTREVIEAFDDPRVHAIHHDKNIGVNAYAEAVKHTTERYLIELDDDVIDAPRDWDRQLLEVFQAVPKAGYIASNIIDDGHSVASNIFYRERLDDFKPYVAHGVRLLTGPVGGYCSITSRAVYDAVGGFPQKADRIFFHEDAEYFARVTRAGYTATIAADLKVLHASGPYYSQSKQIAEAKDVYYEGMQRQRARKERIKRVLFALPLFPAINRVTFRWQPPRPRPAQ